MHKEIICGAALLLAPLSPLGTSASAGEAADATARGALEAYATGRYERAAPALQRCARRGNPRCQLALGQSYLDGKGVPRDTQYAFHWTRAAAEQGLGAAQLQLGVLYVHGDGVTMDYERAIEWVQRAAHQGDPKAKRILHFMLTEARGEDC
jgi:TPR repeat protein